MTSAEQVFKAGFAPQWTAEQIGYLAEACRSNDPRLIQGSTSSPPPLMCVQGWPCEAGCATGYVGAMSNGGFGGGDRNGLSKTDNPRAATVGTVEEFFAAACFQADQRLGEPSACRHFLNWFDDTPRDEMRQTLWTWCLDVLRDRTGGTVAVTPYHAV